MSANVSNTRSRPDIECRLGDQYKCTIENTIRRKKNYNIRETTPPQRASDRKIMSAFIPITSSWVSCVCLDVCFSVFLADQTIYTDTHAHISKEMQTVVDAFVPWKTEGVLNPNTFKEISHLLYISLRVLSCMTAANQENQPNDFREILHILFNL